MSDNVVKFRRPEKQPDPKQERPRAPLPGWVPFAALVGIAILIYFVQHSLG